MEISPKLSHKETAKFYSVNDKRIYEFRLVFFHLLADDKNVI